MASSTPEKPNQDPVQPVSKADKAADDDPILVALKRIVESKKERSVMDQLGNVLQLLATLATLFFLVYGFIRFSELDELAKRSETTSKVVTAQYDKASRISVDGNLDVEVDKKSEASPNSLFSVGWNVSVKNLSKKPALITVVHASCYIGKWADQSNQKEFFEPFGPPEIVEDSKVTWTKAYVRVSYLALEDQAIKQTFGSEYRKFVNDQNDRLACDNLGDPQEKAACEKKTSRAFLTTWLKPDEGANETEGFLVRASRSDHVACDSVLRVCYEDENGQGICTDAEAGDSTHLWLASSSQNQNK
jgi:hypothetical protein